MRTILRMEMRRVFESLSFRIALAVGLVLAIGQVVTISVPYGCADIWSSWRNGDGGTFPPSFYTTWIGLTPYSVFTMAYYYAVPLLACLPAADSLCSDIHSGYALCALARSNRKSYFAGKTAAIALSAVICVDGPLLLNIIATACFVPALPPDPAAGTFFVGSANMLADLYYTEPLAFMAVFVFAAGILAVCCATLSCALSFISSNRFIVMLVPTACCLALQFATQGLPAAGLAPINAICPWQPADAAIWLVAPIGVIALAATLTALVLQGRNYEDCR